METVNLDYLAGFFDGEGCISINKNRKLKKQNGKYYIQYNGNVIVANTNREILELFKKRFGGNIYELKAKNRHQNNKPSFQWIIYSKMATNFCEEMVDRLILKKRQAEILASLQSLKDGKWRDQERLNQLQAFKDEITQLNKKGKGLS